MRRTQREQAWKDLDCLLSSKFITNQTKKEAVSLYNEKHVWSNLFAPPEPQIRVEIKDIDKVVEVFQDFVLTEEN